MTELWIWSILRWTSCFFQSVGYPVLECYAPNATKFPKYLVRNHLPVVTFFLLCRFIAYSVYLLIRFVVGSVKRDLLPLIAVWSWMQHLKNVVLLSKISAQKPSQTLSFFLVLSLSSSICPYLPNLWACTVTQGLNCLHVTACGQKINHSGSRKALFSALSKKKNFSVSWSHSCGSIHWYKFSH